MASDGTRGRRVALAIQRIETAASRIGGEPLVIPRRSRYDAELLAIFQLEAIATYLESVNAQPAIQDDFRKYSNRALEELIKSRGLMQGNARNKDELIAVLKTAEQEPSHA